MTDTRPPAGHLVVTCGLPGVGKSTVAEMIAEETGGTLLRTDVIRHELFADPQYDSEEDEATYEELFSRAASKLRSGADVVLDATFSDRTRRESARRLARTVEADLHILVVASDTATVAARLSDRSDDASDAGFQAYLEKRRTFDEISADHTVIDNSGSIEATRRVVEQWVQETLSGE